MFKVSLPSTHSNIFNFCIHFQASPSASDFLTHIYLCIFSVRVCVRIQSVSFSISVYIRFSLILHRTVYFFSASALMAKKYQAWKVIYLVHLYYLASVCVCVCHIVKGFF